MIPITVYVGRHPIMCIIWAVQFCRLIPEEVCHVYIYTDMKGNRKLLECFIVDCSAPCLRGVGVKVLSGKEDTTLLSMVDLSCKTSKCIDNHQIWNKTPDSRVSKGERTHRG